VTESVEEILVETPVEVVPPKYTEEEVEEAFETVEQTYLFE
jgi:hypothetical protein